MKKKIKTEQRENNTGHDYHTAILFPIKLSVPLDAAIALKYYGTV